MLKKCVLLPGVFLLFALTGCGQENADKANAAAESLPEAAAVLADQAIVEDEDDDDAEGEVVNGPASRSEMVERMAATCVESMYHDLKDVAKRKQFCGCVNHEVYGKLSDAEFQAWLNELAWRGKLLKEVLRNPKGGQQLDSATEARLDRGNREWAERYAQGENTCMKQVGVTVNPVYPQF
ncbi:hypothetical protein FACS1894185_3500 [Betaproteobacteria bacterium]|nr:hypothetical protein FACS1894185_3500 [Betaproteobacteria bacterium]GHU15457.1 hypothetical protein FACS189441_7140 [Betaproteobacteria bacterium]